MRTTFKRAITNSLFAILVITSSFAAVGNDTPKPAPPAPPAAAPTLGIEDLDALRSLQVDILGKQNEQQSLQLRFDQLKEEIAAKQGEYQAARKKATDKVDKKWQLNDVTLKYSEMPGAREPEKRK